ncbi:hypothetical protein PENTCL1PPCAC_5285 [Pristionchus entomophagus]|uniref:Uncharacterized protein n=1 Tax=Pristionchus entomophagus TaxID=358040 RepID=A0AAV5SKR4_9BILA|nr:hypothetical protein PENTCL1PPCAC_5285 [Pristionchus entomophagus]
MVQVERAKWNSLVYGGFLVPEFSKARFDRTIEDTVRVKVVDCKRFDGVLKMNIKEGRIVRQNEELEEIFDELEMGSLSDSGELLSYFKRRQFFFSESNRTKFVEKCIPDAIGRDFMCEEVTTTKTVKPSKYINVTGNPRILWNLDVSDGIIIGTNAKELTYTTEDGNKTLHLKTPFIRILCGHGELFHFGEDMLKCAERTRRDIVIKSSKVRSSLAHDAIQGLESHVQAIDTHIRESESWGIFSIFADFETQFSVFVHALVYLLIFISVILVIILIGYSGCITKIPRLLCKCF